MPFPTVYVSWVDSCDPADNAEVELHEVPKPQQIYQVGLLIKETEQAISIAGAWKPGDNVFDYVITIPRSAVTKVVPIS